MLVLEHMKQIVEACRPGSREEFKELWAMIRPVKFGNAVSWSSAQTLGLARYQVPRDNFNVILRVECYTVDFTSGAADYGAFEPPPPGTAYWQMTQFGSNTAYNVTDPNLPVQILLDSDEFLIFRGGYNALLVADVDAPPDGLTRTVRTLVYSYNCHAKIVERIGSNQVAAILTA